MTLPVHVIGGVFLTGVAAALAGVSILEPMGIAVTAVGSVLPDIDHTKSPVGRMVPPLSKYLNRRHGHRNLTHSAVFTAALCFVLAIVESFVSDSTRYTLIFGLAYSSHILLDMFTLHGVGLFYPFVRNMAVLPGNAKYRVKTGNPRTEAGIFFAFCIVTIGALPLLQQGFWTSYNRTFSTPMHLVSEFGKSADLLAADYHIRRGSREEKGKGFVISPGPSVIVLFEDGLFKTIDTKTDNVLNITPEHTGRDLYFETIRFDEVSADSLAFLTMGMKILKGEVFGSREFFAMGESRKSWKVSKLVGLRVRDDYQEDPFLAPEYVEPARLSSLNKQIDRLKRADEIRRAERAEAIRIRNELEGKVKKATDLIERQRLQGLLSAVRVPELKDSGERILQLEAELLEVLQASGIDHDEKTALAKEKWEDSKSGPLKLSGYLEIVKFNKSK